ncbi:MAG TPA: radical SAM protein [Candidatus Eisenbacteria bacterium]|nr:radical SAM protein [Candidatus Eisenbacteria bacterium]
MALHRGRDDLVKRLRVLLIDVSHVTLETTVDMLEYPLGLLYVATALRNAHGERVELRVESHESRGESLEGIERLLCEWKPDVLGLRSLTMGRGPLHEIASLAKRRFGTPWVIAGGPHASDDPGDVLANEAFDVAVIGEGERTAAELVGRLLDGRPLRGVPGTAWREGGGVSYGPPRPLIERLDDLPLPDYSLVDFRAINRGHVDFSFRRDVPHANLFTSRGCPYHCLYCHQIFGKSMRCHSAERLMAEVRRLHDEFGVTRFQIIDDIFNLDRERALEFFDQVVRSGLDLVFSFPNGLRGDRMDDELIDAMWSAGVRYVCYAVESGSPRIQKLIRKRMQLERIREAIAKTTARGIVTRGFFMLGFPTETEEEALATVAFAKESDLAQAMFFVVVYFPGTPLYRLAQSVRDMSAVGPSLADDYVKTREGPYFYSRERLDAIKTKAIRDFFFSRKRVEIMRRVLPNFFPRRDIDAAMLASVISSGLEESEVHDPDVAAAYHRHFLVTSRFSEKAGFFV